MAKLLAALDAFVQEHRRCGELGSDVEGEMVCSCGTELTRPVWADEAAR